MLSISVYFKHAQAAAFAPIRKNAKRPLYTSQPSATSPNASLDRGKITDIFSNANTIRQILPPNKQKPEPKTKASKPFEQTETAKRKNKSPPCKSKTAIC